MLESRLLSEDDLRCLDAELGALEERIPSIHRQVMYTEAVLGQDCTWGLETGKAPDALVAFADLRFFYPLLWLQAALDKEYTLRQYLAEDFSAMMPTPPRSAFVFSNAFLPALKPAGGRFHALTARVRAMRALLRAEAFRRSQGDFPETLPDLPTDPFTGKPMRYRYGIAEFRENVILRLENSLDFEARLRKAKVVQIWSVGPNREDDGGVIGFPRKDDPCAKIRLE